MLHWVDRDCACVARDELRGAQGSDARGAVYRAVCVECVARRARA